MSLKPVETKVARFNPQFMTYVQFLLKKGFILIILTFKIFPLLLFHFLHILHWYNITDNQTQFETQND